MNEFRLGISSYTYAWSIGVPGHPVPDPLSVLGLLDKAVALGVGVVQIADNLPLDRMPTESLERLKRSAEDREVQIEVGARGVTHPIFGVIWRSQAGLNPPSCARSSTRPTTSRLSTK